MTKRSEYRDTEVVEDAQRALDLSTVGDVVRVPGNHSAQL